MFLCFVEKILDYRFNLIFLVYRLYLMHCMHMLARRNAIFIVSFSFYHTPLLISSTL